MVSKWQSTAIYLASAGSICIAKQVQPLFLLILYASFASCTIKKKCDTSRKTEKIESNFTAKSPVLRSNLTKSYKSV